jgi:hypothetical protein
LTCDINTTKPLSVDPRARIVCLLHLHHGIGFESADRPPFSLPHAACGRSRPLAKLAGKSTTIDTDRAGQMGDRRPGFLFADDTLAGSRRPAPELDSKLRGSATEMMQRVTREMLDRPYYHGSFIMLRANSQR